MQGNLQQDLYMELVWKIDSDHLEWAHNAGILSERAVGTVVNVFLHKDASTRVLCLDYSLIPEALAVRSNLRMTIAGSSQEEDAFAASPYASNNMLSFVNTGTLFSEPMESQKEYGLVIVSEPEDSRLQQLRKVISIGGCLLLHINTDDHKPWDSILKSMGFSGIETLLSESIIVTRALNSHLSANFDVFNDDILLVYRHAPTSLQSIVSSRLQKDGWRVRSQAIASEEQFSYEQVILLADIEGPLLADIQEQDLKGLIRLTETASAITWVTCGGLLTGDKPEYGMTSGASRTIRNEKGSLDLVTVDFDAATSEHRLADLLAEIVHRQHGKKRNGETEYCIQSRVAHIGRLLSHQALNRTFVSDSGETKIVSQRDQPALTAQLDNGTVIYNHIDKRTRGDLGSDEVEVHIAAMGLSEADGADESDFLSHEIVGTVTRVGCNVRDIAPDAHVVGFSLEKLSTFQYISSELLHVVPDEWSLIEAATLPSAFVSALYSLQVLASIQPGENVVIFDNMGAVGQAAVQLCSVLRANAIMVTSSAATEAYLREKSTSSTAEGFGFKTSIVDQPSNIKAEGRMRDGSGIDIIFCSTTTDEGTVMEWSRFMAPMGRIVTLGRSNDYRTASAGLSASTRGLSCFQFDLATKLKHRPQIVAA
jgi:NADPH:quinone reductase-like Zn-dependent oxidoreductase